MTPQQRQAVAKAKARLRLQQQGQAAPAPVGSAAMAATALTGTQGGRPSMTALRNVNRAPQMQGPGYADMQGSEIVGSDLNKTGRTLPQHLGNAVIGAAESMANLPADTINSARQANASHVVDEGQALRNVNRMPQLQARVGAPQPSAPPMLPTVQAPRIPIADEDQSISGSLLEGLAQWMIARRTMGKGPSLGRDLATTGVAFQGNTGRVSDWLDTDSMAEGPLRTVAEMLKSQPDDSPLMGRFKNILEDAGFVGPMLAPQPIIRAVGAVSDALKPQAATPTNAGGARPGPTRPQAGPPQAPAAPVAQATPQPSVAPVAQPTVPQGPPRSAQAGASGAGQQAPAATLNATVQPGQNVTTLAKSDARNLRNLMRAAGVPRNDVDALLVGMVQDFNRINDPRMRLAFFAAEYLPQKLPKPVSDAVLAQFDAFGFQQLTDSGPGAGVMKASIDEVRGTQKPFLEGEFDAAFGKQDLITTKGKIRKLKADNADAIYKTQIERQQQNINNSTAAPEQTAARDELLLLMGGEDFFKRLPEELSFRSRNEGYGSLWEYVHQRPLESAHWLQSRLGEIARKGGDNAGMYREMRTALLKQIEEAVPGYRGARRQHGDAIGQEIATSFGKDVRAAARDRLKVAELKEDYDALPSSQKAVARLAMKEALTNEFRALKGASRVDPATGNPIDPQQVMIAQLQKDGVMDALETIFGKKGQRATEAIRKVMRENEGLPKYRSDTAPNIKKQEGAVQAVRSPANKLMQGVSEKTGYSFTVPADMVAMAVGAPPVFTASKVAGDVGSFLSKPNPKKMASTANVLYGMKPAGGASPPVTKQRRISPPSSGKRSPKVTPPTSPAALEDLRKQYDAVDPGANPTEAERIRKAILRMESELSGTAKPKRAANRLRTTGGNPPAVGPNTARKLPGQESQSHPSIVTIPASGAAAAAIAPEDQRGAAFVAGAAGGGFLGNRLSKAMGPKTAPRGKPNGPPVVKAKPAFDQRFMKEAQQLVSYNGGVEKALRAQQYTIDLLIKNKASQDRINRAVSVRYAIERMAGRANRELDEIAATTDEAPPQSATPKPPAQSGIGGSKLPMDEGARTRSLLQTLARPNEPQRVADLLAGTPVSVTREEAKEMLDLIRMHLRPEDPYEYGKGFGFTLDDLKADPSIAEHYLDYDPRKLAQFQAVLGTVTEEGSSKLLAGVTGNKATLASAGGGIAYGELGPLQDMDRDGDKDAEDRQAMRVSYGMGGIVTPMLVRGAAGMARGKGGKGPPNVRAPDQGGFGAKPPPKGPSLKVSGPRPMMSPKVIRELDAAKKTLPPEVRNKLAANAAKPPAMRVSAAEAAGDDPSIYTVAAPFQRTRGPRLGIGKRPGRNAVEKGIIEGVARVDRQAGSPPPLEPAAEAVRLAERQRRTATSDATRTANKLNPYVREAKGLPDRPLPKGIASREKEATELAIAAKQSLAQNRLSADAYEQAVAAANQRKAAIADALLTGRMAPPDRPGATPTGVLPGSAGQSMPPRKMPPVSRRDADEMAALLFNREQAQLLDDVLSGRVVPRDRSAHHAALLIAAGTAAGAAGVGSTLALMEDHKQRNAKPAPTPDTNYDNPGDPRFVWDWEKLKTGKNKAIEALQINLNALPPNDSGARYKLRPDGYYGDANSNTDRAVKAWLYQNGFDPDGPFTMEHMDLLDQQALEARRTTRAAPARGPTPGRTPTPRTLAPSQ
jgi:hypothetical protein